MCPRFCQVSSKTGMKSWALATTSNYILTSVWRTDSGVFDSELYSVHFATVVFLAKNAKGHTSLPQTALWHVNAYQTELFTSYSHTSTPSRIRTLQGTLLSSVYSLRLLAGLSYPAFASVIPCHHMTFLSHDADATLPIVSPLTLSDRSPTRETQAETQTQIQAANGQRPIRLPR